MNKYILFLFGISGAMHASLYQAYNDYTAGNYACAQQKLESLQVDDPDNPYLSYNAGLAYYKQGAYEDAITSFKRVIHDTTANSSIKEQAQFNLGNSLYRQAVDLAKSHSSSDDKETDKIDQALKVAQSSLEEFESLLTKNENHQAAQKNKVCAQELCKTIEEAKQEKQRKEGQQQGDGSQEGADKGQDQAQDHGQQESGEKQSGLKQEEHTDNDENQSDGANKVDESASSQKPNATDESEGSQEDNSQGFQEDKDGDSQAESSQGDKEGESSSAAVSSSEQKNVEQDMEMRALQAVLDTISNKEDGLQKALIRLKTQGSRPRPGKHNW